MKSNCHPQEGKPGACALQCSLRAAQPHLLGLQKVCSGVWRSQQASTQREVAVHRQLKGQQVRDLVCLLLLRRWPHQRIGLGAAA